MFSPSYPNVQRDPKDHNSLVNMFIWIYLWFAHKVSSTFIECFLIFGLCQLYPIFSWHFWLNWWVFVFFVCSPSLPIPLDGIFPGRKISVHCLKFTPDIFNIIPVVTGKSFRFLGSTITQNLKWKLNSSLHFLPSIFFISPGFFLRPE